LKRIIKEVKDFLSFSKSERRGILVLISLICLLLLFYLLYPYLLSQKQYDHTAFDREVKAYLKTQEDISKKNKVYSQKADFDIFDIKHSVAEHTLNPFPFDPNTLAHEQWLALGISVKQAKVIENYRSKGGKFYDKEDFRKMYSISPEEYAILEPYIEIHLSKPEFPQYEHPKKEVSIIKTDINAAGMEELKKIKGIGDYFARQIVEYRIKLGGYYRIEQLLEIYKMDSSRFYPLVPYLEVNPNAVRKINVNKADFDQLKSQPYIGYNIALSLINYRIKHGNYAQLSDIKKSLLINDKNYFKISQYLCVE
jgi:competence protein ComEA